MANSTFSFTIWVLVFVLLVSGVGQPLLIQDMDYEGVAEKFTLLYMLPNYVGMTLLLALPRTMLADSSSGLAKPRAKDSRRGTGDSAQQLLSSSEEQVTERTAVDGKGYGTIARKLKHTVVDPPGVAQTAAVDVESGSEAVRLDVTPVKDDSSVGLDQVEDTPTASFWHVTAWPRWARILLVAFLDVFSFTGCFFGMMFCGSSIYTVIYASVTTNTAILSRVFLGRRLNWAQWMACLVVTGGLGVSAIGTNNLGSEVMLGALMVLVGTIMHSMMYVANECVMSQGTDRLPPIRLCGLVGLFGLVCILIWQGIWTIPRWHDEVVVPLEMHHTPVWEIVALYVGTMFMCLIHNSVFYVLLGRIGSVTTGVLKGLTAISVFVVGSLAFCAEQPSQCFTPMRGVSLALVVGGVFVYSFATRQAPPTPWAWYQARFLQGTDKANTEYFHPYRSVESKEPHVQQQA